MHRWRRQPLKGGQIIPKQMQSNEGHIVAPEGEKDTSKDNKHCRPRRISAIPSNDSVEGLVSNIASTLHVEGNKIVP